jgi:hypothetical protein
MTDQRHEQCLSVAGELTRGMQANDAAALAEVYSPTAVVWHNNDRRELAVRELLEVVQIMQRRSECSIDVELRQVTEDGFLQTHTAKYTFVDGTTAEVSAALIAWVDDAGRITRVKEYLDGADLAPLIAAITSTEIGQQAADV